MLNRLAWAIPKRFVLMCVIAVPAATSAQVTVRTVESDAACQTCEAELIPEITLGPVRGPGALAGQPKFVVRLTDGRFIVSGHTIPTRLLVFDANGEFNRQVGREGSGPGEFRFITAAYVDSDGRIHVTDSGTGRETVFNDIFDVVNTTHLQGLDVHEAAVGPDGQAYYNGDLATAEAIGLPIHILADDHITSSFGALSPIRRPDVPWLGQRALAPGVGGVWTARRTHYYLERWTPKGTRTDALERKAPWFEPYLMRPTITPDQPPKPWVMALRLISRDVLLVLINVASRDFPDGLQVRERRDGQVLYDYNDCAVYSDTLIEGIAVKSGRLLFSTRRDECLLGFVGDLAYGYRLENNAIPQIDLYRLKLPTRVQSLTSNQ